jgi:hypothetical protein
MTEQQRRATVSRRAADRYLAAVPGRAAERAAMRGNPYSVFPRERQLVGVVQIAPGAFARRLDERHCSLSPVVR